MHFYSLVHQHKNMIMLNFKKMVLLVSICMSLEALMELSLTKLGFQRKDIIV